MGRDIEIKPIYETPSTKPKTVVLWVSRHPPLQAQIQQLEQKLGAVTIIQVSGVIPNADFVVDVARRYNAKIIVPVLPLSFIARLAELTPKMGITLLFAKMNNIATTRDVAEARRIVAEAPDRRTLATYADGTVRVFEFVAFEKIKRVVVETEPW